MAQDGRKTKSSRHFIAGLGSGVSSAVLLQPLDLLKTRVQQSGHRSLSSYLRELAASPSPGTAVRALWRGTVPSALRTGFGSALYFTTLNAIRSHVARSNILGQAAARLPGKPSTSATASVTTATTTTTATASSSSLPTLSNSANLVAGAAARTFAGLVLMPLTVIKVRYESNLYAYRSIPSAARDIYATGGPRGFFSGFGATAARDAPYAGMYVLFYEMLKKRLSRVVGGTGSSPESSSSSSSSSPHSPPLPYLSTSRATLVNFTSGSLAAALCSAVSNPFDAVKTRIQLQPERYRNMWHAVRRMLAEDGARSLFDGLALRMSRKAMSSALAWTVYEELIRRAERTLTGDGDGDGDGTTAKVL